MIQLIKYGFLILGFFAYSQKTNLSVKVTDSSQIKNVELVTYTPSIKIKKIYNHIEQAKNTTPAELLKSLISENSVEWSRWNNYNKKLPISENEKELFKRKAKIDREKYYSEIVQELYFDYENEQHCWVKSLAHTESKSLGLVYGIYAKIDLMIKVGDRWELYNRYVDKVILRDLNNFTLLKYPLFEQICAKQNPENNLFMTNLLNKVYEGDALNLNALYSELMRMKEDNKNAKSMGKLPDELKYFKDEYVR